MNKVKGFTLSGKILNYLYEELSDGDCRFVIVYERSGGDGSCWVVPYEEYTRYEDGTITFKTEDK